MKSRIVCSGLIVLALVGAAATGCAMMQKRAPEEVIAERQEMMKQHGALWKEIQDKSKAGDIRGIAQPADKLASNADRIPALFPEGSMTPKSSAKPEIWQKRAEFEAAAKKLGTESVRLRDTARTGNADATQAIVKDFGRTTCGNCHTPFRVPPKQS
jgi:cytochrome c556